MGREDLEVFVWTQTVVSPPTGWRYYKERYAPSRGRCCFRLQEGEGNDRQSRRPSFELGEHILDDTARIGHLHSVETAFMALMLSLP